MKPQECKAFLEKQCPTSWNFGPNWTRKGFLTMMYDVDKKLKI